MNAMPLTIRGVCPHDCPDTCGFTVSVTDGRATSLRGDREHPFTRGFLCQKVANYLERTYHPERLTTPLRRVGRKGDGHFERISWDEAIAIITAKFREIATSSDGPQAILPYSYAGTMGKLQSESLDRRFFHRLGASLLDRTICATAGAAEQKWGKCVADGHSPATKTRKIRPFPVRQSRHTTYSHHQPEQSENLLEIVRFPGHSRGQ